MSSSTSVVSRNDTSMRSEWIHLKISHYRWAALLGSGKTTLLGTGAMMRSYLQRTSSTTSVSVWTQSSFDERSIPEQGNPVDRVAALHGKFARKELHTSLARTLSDIAKLNPPPLMYCVRVQVRLAHGHWSQLFTKMLVIIFAILLSRWRSKPSSRFEDGRVLTGESSAPNDPALYYAAGILAEQLIFASVIILTKVDTVSKAVADAQVQRLKKLQPNATIGLSSHAGIRLSQLDATPAPNYETMEGAKLDLDWVATIQLQTRWKHCPSRSATFSSPTTYDVCQKMLGTGFIARPSWPLAACWCPLWQHLQPISFELTSVWAAEARPQSMLKILPKKWNS